MTRWKPDVHPKPPPEPPDIESINAENKTILHDPNTITDDPLAALGLVVAIDGGSKSCHDRRSKKTVYAVSRPPLHLPRVALKNSGLKVEREHILDGGGMNDGDGHLYISEKEGINPLYHLTESSSNSPTPSPKGKKKTDRYASKHQRSSSFGKSGSSGYSGSNEENSLEPLYAAGDQLKLGLSDETVGSVVGRDLSYAKSTKVTGKESRSSKSVPSHSSSSGGGTLSTIPEGKVDLPIPQPIWPLNDRNLFNQHDSLVDDALLLYTSHNYVPEDMKMNSHLDLSVRELLVDLLQSINQTLEVKTNTPEEMLNIINEKIRTKLESLKYSNEEDMRKLCINLSNSKKINSVLRAFSHSSSSGHSAYSCQARTSSSNEEDIYHIPSNSSSSGFSDSLIGCSKNLTRSRHNSASNKHFASSKQSKLTKSKDFNVDTTKFESDNFLMRSSSEKPTNIERLSAEDLVNNTPLFVYDDLSNLSKGVRNALIYGTLCRTKIENHTKIQNQVENTVKNSDTKINNGDSKSLKSREFLSESAKKFLDQTKSDQNKICDNNDIFVVMGNGEKKDGKKRLLGADQDQKPTIWEQYYGVKAEGAQGYGVGEPSDVPVYPGGRPEADFTLDLPRSELLSKRLRKDKKWRCRCRLLTSFLGLIFFLLSVMVVSLILTRGKRMFGSMM